MKSFFGDRHHFITSLSIALLALICIRLSWRISELEAAAAQQCEVIKLLSGIAVRDHR